MAQSLRKYCIGLNKSVIFATRKELYIDKKSNLYLFRWMNKLKGMAKVFESICEKSNMKDGQMTKMILSPMSPMSPVPGVCIVTRCHHMSSRDIKLSRWSQQKIFYRRQNLVDINRSLTLIIIFKN